MSHFTVTVCLEDHDGRLGKITQLARDGFPVRDLISAHLDHVLAPFDENREVEPYRDYEEGGPEDHWLVKSVRRGAESHRKLLADGAEALAAERVLSRSAAPSADPDMAVQAVREAAPGWADDAKNAAELGDSPSWADVAALHNRKYGDEGETLLVDDAGRAYTMSTRNPDAKWDWWQIGGRWGGRFPYREEHSRLVIPVERTWSSPEDILPLHCDGGPKYALDLSRLREEAMAKARKTYADYQAAVAGTPEALPWSVFRDNISEGNGYTIDQAREEYHSQPRIAALSRNRDWAFADNEDFQMPEALYVERARARAVPGYATLTADGRWMAPGEMGWFGMSTDDESSRIGYWEAANAYIEALPDDAWLVLVDMHI